MTVRRRLAALAIAPLAAAMLAGSQPTPAAASTFVLCHDDTLMQQHHWTHGDPNRGLPGDANGNNGYYYLAITAGCSAGLRTTTLVARVHLLKVVKGHLDSTMCWRLDITPDYNHDRRLAVAVLMGSDVTLVFHGAIVGHHYRLRVANIEAGVTVTDHATFDSGTSVLHSTAGSPSPGSSAPSTGVTSAPASQPVSPATAQVGDDATDITLAGEADPFFHPDR